MVNVFKYVDKFFTSLTNYISYNDIFLIFVGLFLFTVVCVFITTANSYEAKLIKAIDKFNAYFIDNPQINEENLVAFNAKMKARFVPKQLRKSWQQFVLYREGKASTYMSFENCVSNPIKNSSYKRDTKIMNVFSYIFAACALILNCYYCYETSDLANVLSSCLLSPVIILLLNYIMQIFFNVKHSAIVSDLFQNYQYFEVNIDKATETLPEYVDYEVLFDRNEIKKGIPILYAYLQKRAEEEQRELERARLRNVEHEKFNFDEAGVEASLVLERAMQEAENYIAERKKYNQDIEQINADLTQEDMNYREITKEYNRQMQVSRETFANFKAQLEEASSTIEANYLKKQQQQELDRQRNLERDFDTATEKHKKVIDDFQKELDGVDKFIAESRKNLEVAMKSEFSTYSSKVYDEVEKIVNIRQKEKFEKLKEKINELEEELVIKGRELEEAYNQNNALSEQLSQVSSEPVNTYVPEQTYQPQEYQPQEYHPTENVAEDLPDYEYEEVDYQPPQSVEQADQEMQEQYEEDYEADEVNYADETDYFSAPSENYQEEANNSYQEDEFVQEEYPDDEFDEDDDSEGLLFDVQYNTPNSEDDEYKDYFIEEEGDESEDAKLNPEFVEEPVVEEKVISANPTDDSIKPTSRRGRPKKVVDVAEKGEQKRRGRPKKETVVEEKPAVKKGRGRPKKVETAEVKPAASKGRGRPKKIDSVAEKPAVKKGRGRPKKVETVETKPVAVKKGRGRPRKTEAVEIKPAVKKGRGRPKKVENTEVKPAVVKNGRGRPKKAVNKIDENTKINKLSKNIVDIDEYLKQIDSAIAAENLKLEETQKELAKNAKLRRKK